MAVPVAHKVSGTPHVFHALDALRGVAAITVVLYHYGLVLHYITLPNAFLAVDFFFVLSGFVIAHAYESRLHSGMTLADFAKRRIIRLYPLYLIGLAISLLPFLGDLSLGLPHQSRTTLSLSYGLSLLFLPTPPSLSTKMIFAFPLNAPTWSLSLELVINILYAAIARRLNTRILAGILTVALVALIIANTHYDGIDRGALWSTYLGGVARVLWSFPLGILIYRFYISRRWPRLPWWTGLLLGLLLLDILASDATSLLYPMFWVVFGFPVLVMAGASVDLRSTALRVAGWLGLISYAIYVLHSPVGDTLHWIYKQRDPDFVSKATWMLWLVWTSIVITVSVVADLADVRLRRFLTVRLMR